MGDYMSIIIKQDPLIQVKAPYNLREELSNNPAFKNHVKSGFFLGGSCCFPCGSKKIEERAAKIFVQATIEQYSGGSISFTSKEGESGEKEEIRTISRFIAQGTTLEAQEERIRTLSDVRAACLDIAPGSSEKRWLKDLSGHIETLETGERSITHSKTEVFLKKDMLSAFDSPEDRNRLKVRMSSRIAPLKN
jgi:hypothetical protein